MNQLHQLQALVVCDAYELCADFCELESHPSLQMIKLVTRICTPTALTSVLQLRQLQELWIFDDVLGEIDEQEAGSSSPVPLPTARTTI